MNKFTEQEKSLFARFSAPLSANGSTEFNLLDTPVPTSLPWVGLSHSKQLLGRKEGKRVTP